MLVKLSTNKTVSEAAAALQSAVQANHFGVMQVHNLQETMVKKGVDFERACLIFEVCQPQQAKKVLDQNMSVSTALPCRISIYEEGGKTVLTTLKPTILLAMFNSPQLKGVANTTIERRRRTTNQATPDSLILTAPHPLLLTPDRGEGCASARSSGAWSVGEGPSPNRNRPGTHLPPKMASNRPSFLLHCSELETELSDTKQKLAQFRIANFSRFENYRTLCLPTGHFIAFSLGPHSGSCCAQPHSLYSLLV